MLKCYWMLIILAVLLGVIILLGMALPTTKTLQMTTTIAAPQHRVWHALSTINAWHTWRTDVAKVTSTNTTPPVFTEYFNTFGSLSFIIDAAHTNPMASLQLQTTPGQLIGATWTAQLTPTTNNTTELRITDVLTATNPFARLYIHYIFGFADYSHGYITDLKRLLATPPMTHTITLQATGAAYQVELATTPAERAKGLMYREYMPPDAGMLFVFDQESPHGFWMKHTRIPLDALWIDTNGTIVDMQTMQPCPDTTPRCPTYAPRAPARYVLELNAGTVDPSIIGTKVTLPSLQ